MSVLNFVGAFVVGLSLFGVVTDRIGVPAAVLGVILGFALSVVPYLDWRGFLNRRR